MSELGLIEINTPHLTSFSGIEPFIDPPKVHYNTYLSQSFFLNTSPEFYLKKALAIFYFHTKGIFEIAASFRDEKKSTLHHIEFTMAEWYENSFYYKDFITRMLSLIKRVILQDEASISLWHSSQDKYNDIDEFISNPCIISIPELFNEVTGIRLRPDFTNTDYAKLAGKYQINIQHPIQEKEWQKIQYFNLLFDNVILPYIRNQKGIWFLYDFPPFARGMATLNSDEWAERIECFIHGIEIMNGYQEIYDQKEVLKVWEYNNSIRKKENKEPHPIDPLLIEATPAMKGVAGNSFGIERLLMALFKIRHMEDFFY